MAKSKKNQNTEGGVATAEMPEEKKVPFCKVSFSEDGTVSFDFSNGTSSSVNVHELPDEQLENLTRHGLTQKVRDSFASAKGDFAFAKAAADKVIEQLKNNHWTASREGGETRPKTTELAQAIANLKQMDLETVQAAVEKATDQKRKEWRANPEVKAEIARIRAEAARARAQAKPATEIDLSEV